MDAMDSTDHSAAPNALPSLIKLPIAQLSPTLEELEEKCILATVSLVWPYSSSTKSLSLSLAEPDFRLRRSNGQVKTIFHGRVAEKVAESHVGIGDTVRLALKGAEFVANDSATQTPGKNVAWDLQFDNGVSLEINRSSKNLSTVFIEQSPRAPHDTELQPPSTPRVISIHPVSDTVSGPGSWLSPAFARIGQSPFKAARDCAFDPFADEDGFVPGRGRKRPRYSFRRDEWRIADSSASSREDGSEELENDWESELEDEVEAEEDLATTPKAAHEEGATAENTASYDQANIETPLQGRSSVFVKPSLDFAGSLFGRPAPQLNNAQAGTIEPGLHGLFGTTSNLPTDTPQLRPVPSPGLPIPSPIVSNNNNAQEYFSPFHAQEQAQTIQSIVTGTDADTTIPAQSSVAYISPTSQSQATIAPAEQLETTQDEQPFSSPTMPGEQESLFGGVTGDEIAGHNNEQHTYSTEFFNLPMFRERPEFNEPNIEMGDAGDDHMVPVAALVNRQSEEIGEVEKATEAEKDVLDQEPAPAAEDDYSHDEAVQGTLTQVAHADHEVAVNAARTAVNMEIVEDEPKVTKSGDELVESSLPGGDRSASRSYDGESSEEDEESGEEDEALYDEDDAADSMLEEGYDEEDDYSDEEYPEATKLPRPQQSQPEVIVLDSDSEDELASVQPTGTPSQPTQEVGIYHRESFIESPVADLKEEEEEEEEDDEGELEGEEEEDYESASDAMEDRAHVEDDERVHDSDMEDESSVDHHTNQHSSRENSVAEGTFGEEHDDDGLDVEDNGPQANQNEFDAREKPESVVDLSSDEDEPEETSEKGSEEAEGEEPRDDHRASLDEPGSPLHMKPKFHDLDGADDRHRMQPPVIAVQDHLKAPEEDIVSERQRHDSDTNIELVKGVSPSDTANQLLTPDHAQEVGSGPQSTPSKEKMVALPTLDESGHPPRLDIALSPGLDTAASTEKAALDEDLVAPEHPAAELLPDTLHIQQHHDSTVHADVAVTTTEDAEVDPNIIKVLDLEKTKPPKVVVSKPPVPDRHARGLRSKLSYFAPLAALIDHYNALVDTISVVQEATPIAKGSSGSRDYFMTIQLTDPSMAGTTLQAQIFRRTKSAMPSVAEGNAVLLRDFKVRSYDHSIVLVSVESSSWAVFDGSAPEAHMSGPPVEYGSEERAYASGLRRWYTEVGTALVADNQLQASIERDSMDRGATPSDVATSEAGSFESGIRGDSVSSARGSRRSRRSNRRVTIHELRDGTRYTEVGSPGSRESIHELRDGTVYADP